MKLGKHVSSVDGSEILHHLGMYQNPGKRWEFRLPNAQLVKSTAGFLGTLSTLLNSMGGGEGGFNCFVSSDFFYPPEI